MFLSSFDFRLNAKGYGFLPVDEDSTLEIHKKDIEGFDGAVLYGELREHYGNQSYCKERFKTIVEPPTKLEKFFGITLESKIKKAVRKMKNESQELIRSVDRGVGNLFGMVMSIV